MKIISFGLWGSNPMYLNGTIENVKLIESLLPDWICRFYIDSNINVDIKKFLQLKKCQIIEIQDCKKYGLMKRFLPLFDSSIERFLIRDTDSRVTPREVHLIRRWEESNFNFFIIRDHIAHTFPIMGGVWGGKPNILPKEFEHIFNSFIDDIDKYKVFHDYFEYYNCDQFFLRDELWKYIKEDHLGFVRFPELIQSNNEFVIDYPLNNSYHFIGQKYNQNNQPMCS
jgi:hypothetical protein